jgi:hypothetical protein
VRWFKVAAVVGGVIVAFLIVSSVVGFIVEAAIAVLVVAVIDLGVKVALGRKQVSWKRPDREVRGLRHSTRLRRHITPDVEDELSRMKGDMRG